METITLVKDYKKRQFSPKAAKIAIEHFGWSELTTPARPSEVGTKTKPPVIDKPVILKPVQSELKDYPIEKKVEPVKVNEIQDLTAAPVEVKQPVAKVEPAVKKTRKSPVKSKSKSK